MNQHLDFNEIVEFIYSDNIDANKILAHRVNSHIFNCKKCRQVYDTIYDVYELGFEKGIVEVNRNIKEIENQHIVSFGTLIRLKIDNNKKLVLEQLKNIGKTKYFFSYPLELATRSSGGKSEQYGILVDDENEFNEIALKNGKLIVKLDAEDFEDDIPVLMIRQKGGEILFLDSMERENDCFYSEVVVPEECELEIKFG